MKIFTLKTLFMSALLCVGLSAWGETSTLTFTKACGGYGTADDGTTWTVTSDGAESNFDNDKGIHYGTGSKAVQYITLSTSSITGTISKIVVNASTASTVGDAVLNATVGGASFGEQGQNASSTATDYTFTGSATGEIVVSIIRPSATKSALYVKSIAVTYTAASASPLSSIALSGNYLTEFYVGDDFSNEGMTVTATYEDNSTKDVTSEAAFSGYDKTRTGEQTVTVSYTEASVTKTTIYNIIVNANPTHNVTWNVNGTTTTEEYERGTTITFPANPEELCGKSFVGWTTEAISGTTDTEPAFVSSAKMGNEDVTYYAVFANGCIVTDELTQATTGASANSYSEWSDKTLSSSAVYAGQSAGGTTTNPSIQLRSSNNNSGIISTTSGGKVTKVSVEWNSSTTSGRTLDIYGKNTAYTAASDLYNTSKQGTKLGSIECGTSTELIISDEYTYIGVRSNNGALYLDKLSIRWGEFTDYCTTVVAPSVTVSAAGYATYTTDVAVDYKASGVTAYVVSAVTDDKVTLTEVESVPANTPVVVKAETAGTYPLTVIESADAVGTNYLKVSDGTKVGGDNVFALAKKDGEVGFYAVSNTVTIPAGKCYLDGTANAKSRLCLSFEGEDATGIQTVKNIKADGVYYNLRGQRVVNPMKGIYILNGKKILVNN
ncbi:MAG: bacterial Ig-like domain-containing protein [Bacteroidaceae bacterium]|nr:bacterial Ig-like domain-containing protein [Bacteroidaceae bacterium]